MKPDWAAECALHLRNTKSTKLIEDAFQQFLYADLNIVGEGCLPDNVVKMHDKILQGKYVVQIGKKKFRRIMLINLLAYILYFL